MPVLMCFSVLTPHRRKIPFQIWHTILLEPASDTVGEVRTLAGRGSGIVWSKNNHGRWKLAWLALRFPPTEVGYTGGSGRTIGAGPARGTCPSQLTTARAPGLHSLCGLHQLGAPTLVRKLWAFMRHLGSTWSGCSMEELGAGLEDCRATFRYY